jgi:hypothetical protein
MLNTTFEERLHANKVLSDERKAQIRRRRELNEAKKLEREEQREHTIWQVRIGWFLCSRILQRQFVFLISKTRLALNQYLSASFSK